MDHGLVLVRDSTDEVAVLAMPEVAWGDLLKSLR